MARRQGQRPGDQMNPAESGTRRLEHRGQRDRRRATPGSPARSRKRRFTQKVTADTRAPTTLLHVRRSIPGCTARSKSSVARRRPPRATATAGSALRRTPPGAPSFPRRPGRRRSRRPPAPEGQGRRAAAALDRAAAGARPRAPFRAPAADPAGPRRAQHPRSRSARPRCRSCPAAKTRMWTYGGTFPGPTIRRRAGHRTERHLPPRAAGRGGRAHRPPPRRPQPHPVRRPARRPDQAPADLLLLPDPAAASRRASRATTSCSSPGARKTYVYDLIEDGRPERAAFQWYHDHRLDRTARNVWQRPGRDVDRRRRVRRARCRCRAATATSR